MFTQHKSFKRITVKCPLCRVFQIENPHLPDTICNKCNKINNEIFLDIYGKVYDKEIYNLIKDKYIYKKID